MSKRSRLMAFLFRRAKNEPECNPISTGSQSRQSTAKKDLYYWDEEGIMRPYKVDDPEVR